MYYPAMMKHERATVARLRRKLTARGIPTEGVPLETVAASITESLWIEDPLEWRARRLREGDPPCVRCAVSLELCDECEAKMEVSR